MKGNKLILIPLFFLALTGCSKEKRISHEDAVKRAGQYDSAILTTYQSNVTVTTQWEIDVSGAYDGGDLASSLPSLEDNVASIASDSYFYNQKRIESISDKTTTSNGVETTNKFYSYLKNGLKIVNYNKIKTKTNGISYTGFESTTTYIYDDGRVEKIIKEREIKTTSENDDFHFNGQYHYVGNIEIEWVVL